MNTGIESWNVDLMGIGPMYPFVGSEVWLAIVGVLSWLIWHFIQAKVEAKEVAAEQAEYAKSGALNKALDREQA
jgi:hypothetical protein